MNFDKETRNLLSRTVVACRRRLTEDVSDQLRGIFGLHPDGNVLPLRRLTHLSPDQVAAASVLRELFDHYTAATPGKEQDRRKAAYERMVLEMSFTILNRLAALRLCEERDLIIECVRKGTASDGFRLFERISGGALGGRYDAYRVFLESLFDELALDLGVLFDRATPHSAVFPTERCIEDVLAELNKAELIQLWTEDETIGWIYQYFNPPEERKEMREASQAPRNSRELAVRNQFFTPRYVVEFLTDNTLGRIWYEMRKGDTTLKDECRYLVRRPNEVFLASGDNPPGDTESEAEFSQEELLKKPVYIEHRPKKDPRDIKVLDPACGSGHFLLYAFDLLVRIYEEAWNDLERPKSELTGCTLREDFEELTDLRRAIPKLIIEHNLHGIDIDPRTIQIAALALWLRAQKALKVLGQRSDDQPRIAKSNLVTAEPMPGEEDMLREFSAGLKPRVLGQIVEVVFDRMKLAGEAGSLLKIEGEIKGAVAEAKRQWLEVPIKEQQLLFPELAELRQKQLQLRFDLKGVTEEIFWDYAEDRILGTLKEYAEEAENGGAARRRLFAGDAARGLAFIDLCRKKYDVVLMNPPFGEFSKPAKQYASSAYPVAKHDILAAFVQRAHELEHRNGRTGAITAGAWLYLETYADWRDRYIHKQHLSLLMDLGFGVLDTAVVSTVAFCLENTQKAAFNERSLFGDLQREIEKENSLIRLVSSTSFAEGDEYLYIRRVSDFSAVPLKPIVYWVTDEILNVFKKFPAFEPSEGNVYQGIATGDNFRYLRLYWEINPNSLALQDWVTYAKGGESTRFYDDIPLVLRWSLDGADVKARADANYGSASRTIKNEETFFIPGLTTTATTVKGFTVRVLPGAAIYDMAANKIAPLHNERLLTTLGVFNSLPIQVMMEFVTDGRHWYTSCIQRLPWPNLTDEDVRRIEAMTKKVLSYRLQCRRIEETSRIYFPSINNYAYENPDEEVQENISEIVAKAYGLSVADFSALQRVSNIKTRDSQQEALDDENANEDGEQPLIISWESLVSLFVGVLFGRWDIRIALDPLLAPKLQDPFNPLPVCPPGMLVGPDGMPAEPSCIVSEEWLRVRPDANTLPPNNSVNNPMISDSDYPLRISWAGILLNDPGSNGGRLHRDDIVRRIREVLDLLWKDKANEIEQEACEILGVSDLCDYFRKPTGFFQDHLKRYSKSRRKAPIYWPLSTASGSYTIWLYYNRLNDQTIYTAVNRYIDPKIAEVERSLARIERELPPASGREAVSMRDQLDGDRTFLSELKDFREELLRIAAIPYKPNLNDGVLINAAPFYRLFRLRQWAKDTEDCWKKLEDGEYDWAHLAYTIWPDRVREVCKKDRSIAIAHGLEDIWKEANKDMKRKEKSKKRRRVKQ